MLSTSALVSRGDCGRKATMTVRRPAPAAAASMSAVSCAMSSTMPSRLGSTVMPPSSWTTICASRAGVSAQARSSWRRARARGLSKVSGQRSASSPVLTVSMPASCAGGRTIAVSRRRSVSGIER